MPLDYTITATTNGQYTVTVNRACSSMQSSVLITIHPKDQYYVIKRLSMSLPFSGIIDESTTLNYPSSPEHDYVEFEIDRKSVV